MKKRRATKLRRWISSNMVINLEKVSSILYKHRASAMKYFEFSPSGAILFKESFDDRYLILAYLLAKLYGLLSGLSEREDASIEEILELPFLAERDIDTEIERLRRDGLLVRSDKGYCLNYKKLEEVFQLLDDYVSAQRMY